DTVDVQVREQPEREQLLLPATDAVGGERLARVHLERAQDARRVGERVAEHRHAADAPRLGGRLRGSGWGGARRLLRPGRACRTPGKACERQAQGAQRAPEPVVTSVGFGQSWLSWDHAGWGKTPLPRNASLRRVASREAWPCCGELAPMMDKHAEVVQRPAER